MMLLVDIQSVLQSRGGQGAEEGGKWDLSEGGKWDLSEGGKRKQKSKRELFVVFSLIIIQSETDEVF